MVVVERLHDGDSSPPRLDKDRRRDLPMDPVNVHDVRAEVAQEAGESARGDRVPEHALDGDRLLA